MTLITAGPVADFLHEGFDFDENDRYGSTGAAFTTQYGWQWESRFADGGGEIIGIVEWIVLVAGMGQGKFLPSATSLSGVGMVFGVGYNFKSGNLNLPVNIAFMPGRNLTGNIETWNNDGTYTYEEYDYNSGARISIMVGFNMSK